MVTNRIHRSNHCRGSLIAELLVAMALLTSALLPLAYSVTTEKGLARSCYQRAVAMEIVDGEIEVLAAGEWRAHPAGTHPFDVRAAAATNLPPGRFFLTIQTNRVRLEWQPAQSPRTAVVREIKLP